MTKRIALAGLLGLGLAAGAATGAHAQDAYPSEPITVLVGFGAGGMTDVSSRIIAEKLEANLGVRVLVENRPGAGGLLALDEALELPADGYTFVSFLSDGPFTSVFQDRPVDLDDWAILGGFMPQERVLFARTDAPFETVEELVAYAKDTPVTFADGGAFWSARVMEAFAKKNELNIRLVPFRSGAEGSAAILGGHVTLAETGVGTSAWQAGRSDGLKIMATLTPGGLDAFDMPDVPTFEELGADYVVKLQYGYAMRGDTPPERVEALAAALQAVVEDPEVQARLRELDLTPRWMPGDAYQELMVGVMGDAAELKAYLAE